MKQIANVHVRWLIRRDMEEVLQIEQASFDYAWTEDDFLHCLRERNCIGMVSEVGEKIAGLMIYELCESKIRILNFAVHPDFRRSGVGARMVAKLIDKLSPIRRTRITLTVRDSNLPAQLFFKAMGFRATRILPAYYEDSGDDGYRMVWRLADEACVEPTNRVAQYED